MPYIKTREREKLDLAIETLARLLQDAEIGAYNYAITKIILSIGHNSYFKINSILGLLEAVKQEFYRRVVGEYEDLKRAENGDVYNKNPLLKVLVKGAEEQNEAI